VLADERRGYGVSLGLLGFCRPRREGLGSKQDWSVACSGGQLYVNKWTTKPISEASNRVPPDREMLSKKDYTDYEFIVRESERLVALEPAQLLKYYSEHKEDALSTLFGTEGRSLPCTRAGAERFGQIVVRGLKALGPNARKHSASSLTSALKARFVDKAIEIVSAITDENAHELFESVARSLEEGHKELTHYIPCSIAAHRKPDRFTIGPVNFLLQDIFMQEKETGLRSSMASRPTSEWEFEELKKFFSKFSWVASVQVPPCDTSVSTERARAVVQRTLDLFKLVVGSRRAANVRQAYDLTIPDATTTLVSSEVGAFSLSHARRLLDAIVPDDWYDQISEFTQWRVGESIISEHWEKWGDIPEPQQRFLDGLSWHGDAICDQDAQARILKFWTAIERVVSLKDGDPVTERAAIFSVDDVADFPRFFKQCQRLYAKRSNVIHGAEGYKTAMSPASALETEELSKRVLLFYLSVVDGLKLKGTLTRAAVQVVFDRFDAVICDVKNKT
jgi:hypothetical protein